MQLHAKKYALISVWFIKKYFLCAFMLIIHETLYYLTDVNIALYSLSLRMHGIILVTLVWVCMNVFYDWISLYIQLYLLCGRGLQHGIVWTHMGKHAHLPPWRFGTKTHMYLNNSVVVHKYRSSVDHLPRLSGVLDPPASGHWGIWSRGQANLFAWPLLHIPQWPSIDTLHMHVSKWTVKRV